MRKPLAAMVGLAAAALAASVPAATPPPLVAGSPPTTLPNSGAPATPVPFTLIDLTRPATATGSLTQVKFGWATFPCGSAVRIRVFHRAGSTLSPGAQSAPLNITSFDNHQIVTVSLSPALPIEQGDLIGLTGLSNCGNPLAYHGFPTAGYLFFNSDVQSPVSIDHPTIKFTDQLALGATGTTTSYTALVVPGVGSLEGAFGSHFRTSLQLIAPQFGGDVSGKIVFHPLGVSGSSTDPSMNLLVGAGRATSFPDVVAALGQTGLGSLDIVLDADSGVPTVYARVFNDAGADGTSGLGESAVDVTQNAFSPGSLVVAGGCTGDISAPIDPSHLRLNVGVRSLGSNTTVTFTLKDVTGAARATGHLDLEPNEFLQVKSEDVLGVVPGPNDYLDVSVGGGPAIVYGATTDNTTNDPSVQFVYPTACVA